MEARTKHSRSFNAAADSCSVTMRVTEAKEESEEKHKLGQPIVLKVLFVDKPPDWHAP